MSFPDPRLLIEISIYVDVGAVASLLIIVPSNDEYCVPQSFAVLEATPGVPGLDVV
jgi:hypothetical protein